MKSMSSRLFSAGVVCAGVLVVSLAGCSKEERADAGTRAKEMAAQAGDKAKELTAKAGDKAKEVYADSKAAITRGWDKLKTATFDKRGDVEAQAKALAADMDAQAAKLRADYSDAKASASRKAAMEEFKNAEADYKKKAAALGSASADTWDSAKNNTIAAWERLEAAYRKALVE